MATAISARRRSLFGLRTGSISHGLGSLMRETLLCVAPRTHAVSPFALRFVHSAIGDGDEIERARVASELREAHHADARGDRYVRAIGLHGKHLDRAAHA